MMNDTDINERLDMAMRGQDDGPTLDEAFSELISELADDENIEQFTELRMKEIRNIAALSITDDEVTNRFIDNYVRYRVARRRRGRKELVELARALGAMRDEPRQPGGGLVGGLKKKLGL